VSQCTEWIGGFTSLAAGQHDGGLLGIDTVMMITDVAVMALVILVVKSSLRCYRLRRQGHRRR
jgi:hypothetical protein